MIRQSSHSSILDLFYYLNCCYKQLFEVFNEPSYLHSLLLSYEFMNEHSISNQYLNIQLEFLQEIFPSLSYKNSESLKNSNTTEIGSFVDILKSHSLIQTHTQNNKELFEQYNQMLLDIYEKDYLQQKPFFESCIDLLYCNEQCKLQILQQIYPNEDHKMYAEVDFDQFVVWSRVHSRLIFLFIILQKGIFSRNSIWLKAINMMKSCKIQNFNLNLIRVLHYSANQMAQGVSRWTQVQQPKETVLPVIMSIKREKRTHLQLLPPFHTKKLVLSIFFCSLIYFMLLYSIMKTLDEFKAEQEHHSTFSEFLKENCL